MSDVGIFGLEFANNLFIFEIIALEFVQLRSFEQE